MNALTSRTNRAVSGDGRRPEGFNGGIRPASLPWREDNSDPQRVRALPDGRALVPRYEASKQILRAALEQLIAP